MDIPEVVREAKRRRLIDTQQLDLVLKIHKESELPYKVILAHCKYLPERTYEQIQCEITPKQKPPAPKPKPQSAQKRVTAQQPAAEKATSIQPPTKKTTARQPAVKKTTAKQPAVKKITTAQPAVKVAPKPKKRSHLPFIIGGVAGLVVLGIVLALALSGRSTPQAVVTQEPAPKVEEPKAPVAHEHPEPKIDLVEFPRAQAIREAGNDDWNTLCDQIDRANPDMYPTLLKKAKGFDQGKAQAATVASLEHAIKQRSAFLWEFFKTQAEELAKSGRHGEAIKLLGWFPLAMDRSLEDEITRECDRLKTQGLRLSEQLLRDYDRAFSQKNYSDARHALLKISEIGLPETTKTAYSKLADLSKAEDVALREREAAELAKIEEELRAQNEAGARVERLRGAFLELIQARRFEKARELAENHKDDVLLSVLKSIAEMYKEVERALAAKVGTKVTLTFERGPRTGELKSVKNGRVQIDRFVESLYTLKELANYTTKKGLVALLNGDLTTAADELRGTPAAKLIEGSSAYVARHAAEIKKRVKDLFDRNEYEAAIKDLTQLALVPAERAGALKARARAFYMTERFVEAMLDLEQIFAMKALDIRTLTLLNQIWQRANFFDRAVRLYEGAIKQFPNEPELYVNLAKLYMQMHEFEKVKTVLASAPGRLRNYPRLREVAHLLKIVNEPPFAGPTYRYSAGRYDVETDVDQQTAVDVANFMNQVYQDYVKFFPMKKNEGMRFHVKIFSNQSNYVRYYEMLTGVSMRGKFYTVNGHYLDFVKELVSFKGPQMLSILRHEGFHQYIDYFVSNCPSWFNEAYACFFEVEGKMNPERHNGAKQAIQALQRRPGVLPDLKTLLHMDVNTFRTHPYVAHLYAIGWSFVYYLHRSGQKDLLDRYFEQLMSGRSMADAFKNTFGRVNFPALEAKWRVAVFNDRYDE